MDVMRIKTWLGRSAKRDGDSRRPCQLGSVEAPETYSFRASFAFGRSSVLPHFRHRVARIALRA